MPGISHLRAFLEAAQCGSFMHASQRLHLSQTSVSARIKSLENELGVKLFHRRKYGVELNEYGLAFRDYAETAVSSWDQGRQSVNQIAHGNIPVIAGIQQDLWEIFAAPWFQYLKQDFSTLQLKLESAHSDTLCDRVSRGLLDLAIVFMPKLKRGVELLPLAKFSVVLACNRPGSWTGLLPENYYYVDWGTLFEQWHKAQFGDPVAATLSVGVSGIALSAIQKNGGAAYLLAPSIARAFQDDEIYQVTNAPVFEVDVFIAIRPGDEALRRLNPVISRIESVTSSLK